MILQRDRIRFGLYLGLWSSLRCSGAISAPRLASLDAALDAASDGPGLPISIVCDSEADMVANGLSYISFVCCDQAKEVCPSGGMEQWPDTCSSFACYRAVKRVCASCAGFFASDTFSSGSRDAVATIAHTCSAMAVNNPPLYAPRELAFTDLGDDVVDDPCGAVLTDGVKSIDALASFSGAGIGVTFMAPPGKLLEISFEEVTFGHPLQVYHMRFPYCCVVFAWTESMCVL